MDLLKEFITSFFSLICSLGVLLIPPVSDFVVKRIQCSFDKTLEDKKSQNERKNYISKTKFDLEFSLYRDLTRNFNDLIDKIYILIPNGIANVPVFNSDEKRDEYERKIHREAAESYNVTYDCLKGNIPFIPESFYNEYKTILQLCHMQLDVYEQRWNASYALLSKKEIQPEREDFKRTREIKCKFESLNGDIRKYLENLDVLE